MSQILTQTQLIATWTAVNTDQTGATFNVRPPNGAAPNAVGLVILGRLQQAGGATSPTSRVIIEFSMDGTEWFETPFDGLSLNADGSASRSVEMPVAARFVRARLDLGGGTLPTVSARVEIAADGPVNFTQVT